MQLAQREFTRGERRWVIDLIINPVQVSCYESDPQNPSPCYTEFEEEQFGAGKKQSWTLEEACALFEELIRRREADGWVEDERTESIRCFHHPDRSPPAYWTIRCSDSWSDSVEEESSPAGETGANGEPMKRSRVQRWEFDDEEEVRSWYAFEVARRLSEGYIELFRRSSEFSELGSDLAILSETVDSGELVADSYAEPGSPTALWMEHHRRPAWKPVTVEGDGPDTASKFSGLPWLSGAEDWPECPACRGPMQLLVQLALDTLPPEIGPSLGEGLLQFFACLRTECELSDENFMKPYPKNQVRRIIRPVGAGRAVIPENLTPLPPKLITGWTVRDDYPAPEEWRLLKDKESKRLQKKCIPFDAEDLSIQFPTLPQDKLGGWPYWIQREEYPKCEICKQRMRIVFQLDSGDNLPHRWGCNGVAHLTQCLTHKEVLAFDCSSG